MKCLHPHRITKNLDLNKFPQGIEVPCGQCMSCRILKREEWTLRMLHEAKSWDSLMFITLTYSDNYLPENESLCKSDLQKFFKRLRKALGKRKIKYFASGEYGETTGRPHYHIILFGLDYLNKDDVQIIKDCWQLCDWSQLGKKPFGDVSTSSIRYVVSYIEKTITGKLEDYAYENVEKPFHVLSKGLGRNYAKDSIPEITQGYFEVSGSKRSVPRYYRKITSIDSPDSKKNAEEREKEIVKSLIGVFATRDEVYLSEQPEQVLNVERAFTQSNVQHDKNIKSKIIIKSRSSKKDI